MACRSRCESSECAGMQGDSAPQTGNRATALGQHLDEQRDGEPDDVEEVSLDAGDEGGAGFLDRVGAGAAAPLAPAPRTCRSPRRRAAGSAPSSAGVDVLAPRRRRAASETEITSCDRPTSSASMRAASSASPACRARGRRRRRPCPRRARSRPPAGSTESALPRLLGARRARAAAPAAVPSS